MIILILLIGLAIATALAGLDWSANNYTSKLSEVKP
jgi:hypothetical protein